MALIQCITRFPSLGGLSVSPPKHNLLPNMPRTFQTALSLLREVGRPVKVSTGCGVVVQLDYHGKEGPFQPEVVSPYPGRRVDLDSALDPEVSETFDTTPRAMWTKGTTWRDHQTCTSFKRLGPTLPPRSCLRMAFCLSTLLGVSLQGGSYNLQWGDGHHCVGSNSRAWLPGGDGKG